MAKCAMNCKPNKSFGADRSNENKRNWSEEKYVAKNTSEDKNHHYDITRRKLNFQVIRKRGKSVIEPLDPSVQIDQRLQARLDELGFKGYKEGAKNAPISSVSIVFSGDTAVMRELAFGQQHVDFNLKSSNAHIKRMPEIERMAIAAYDHACKTYGAENVIDFSAHLDEVTPHFHCLVVPTAQRKSRGRAKTIKGPDGKALRGKDGKPIYEEKASKQMVSFSGFFGDSKAERAAKTEALQTAYWKEVGGHFGLDRADCLRLMTEEERTLRKAKNSRSKVQLEADRLAEVENSRRRAEAKKLVNQVKDLLQTVNQREEAVAMREATIGGLSDENFALKIYGGAALMLWGAGSEKKLEAVVKGMFSLALHARNKMTEVTQECFNSIHTAMTHMANTFRRQLVQVSRPFAQAVTSLFKLTPEESERATETACTIARGERPRMGRGEGLDL